MILSIPSGLICYPWQMRTEYFDGRFVKVFDSVLLTFIDHVFHLGVENIVVNFLCVDLASDSCEKRGEETVEICCCWSWREGSWQCRDPRFGDA